MAEALSSATIPVVRMRLGHEGLGERRDNRRKSESAFNVRAQTCHRYSERKFAAALYLDIRTIKRYVAAGKIRSVKLSARCRRLEDPADFQARQAGQSAR
jgi:ribosomal protein S18